MRQQDIETQVRDAVDSARRNPWTERIARAGFVAKGLVYFTVGALAALAAAGGRGGDTTDTQGAIARIATYPFGQLLMAFLAAGLFAYGIWRIFQAIADTDGEGRGAKGMASRLGFVATGLLHIGLGVFAGKILLGPLKMAMR